MAFRDIRPAAAVHLLVIPRAHIATVYDLRAGPDDARLGVLSQVHHFFLLNARKPGNVIMQESAADKESGGS